MITIDNKSFLNPSHALGQSMPVETSTPLPILNEINGRVYDHLGVAVKQMFLFRFFVIVGLIFILGEIRGFAFWAPLQSISAAQVGNSVVYSVYDPVRQQTLQGNSVVTATSILTQDGIVAWYDASGHVGFAVYDPNLGTWKIGSGAWGGAIQMINSGGVVACHMRGNDQ